MGLFKPDLYRFFGIGFVAGALLVGFGAVDNWDSDIAPPAYAAEAVQPAEEFLIPAE